ASEEPRRSFERVARDIRSANSQMVGNYDGTTFTPLVNGTNLSGNSVRIFLTTNSASITYWFNTNAGSGNYVLYRFHTGDSGPTVVADHLQNSATFDAENYAGQPQSSV